MSGELEGKVALVTGASRGIGRAIAVALGARGAKVVVNYTANEAAAVDTVQMVSAAGGSATLERFDVADAAAATEAAIKKISGEGGLHILVNNGALGLQVIRTDHMTKLVDIEEITPATWQRFMAVNVSGAWNMTRASIAHMRAQRWGRIINVTTSFFTMLRGGFHPYGPAKAALEAMSAGHASEFAASGVTVNVVVPGGPANTPMVPKESGINRAELIQPEVMAPPVLWLCSDAAGHVSGNRYVAAHWDSAKAPEQAERECRAPIAWPGLAQSPVWPGGKPDK